LRSELLAENKRRYGQRDQRDLRRNEEANAKDATRIPGALEVLMAFEEERKVACPKVVG
jgi:hypothetical protein